jgi:hypothetical protein
MSRRRVFLLTAVTLLLVPALGFAGSRGQNFSAHLSGDEEVPARETRAVGQAIFHLNEAGDALAFKLISSNIENVVQAHIHLGAFGTNGPIVAFLFGVVPAGGGRASGVLSEGVITADDLINALAGQPLSMLVTMMRNGGAYVNVHTNDGVPPVDTGPGDFPGGEVRGQIEAHGPKP